MIQLSGSNPEIVSEGTTLGVEQKASISKGAAGPGSAYVNGKLYVLGGFTQSGGARANIYEVDPSAGTSTQVAQLGTARTAQATAQAGDSVYVFGGGSPEQTEYTTVTEFNTNDATVSTVADLSEARFSATAVAASNGNIYIFGGRDSNDNIYDTIEEFNPSNNSISQVGTLPKKLADAGAVEFEGKIWLFGGSKNYSNVRKSIFKFDPSNDSVTTANFNLPEPLFSHTAEVLDSKIFLFGGQNSSGRSSHVLEVKSDGRIRKRGELPVKNVLHTSTSASDEIFLSGGVTSDNNGNLLPINDVLSLKTAEKHSVSEDTLFAVDGQAEHVSLSHDDGATPFAVPAGDGFWYRAESEDTLLVKL